MDSLRKLKGKLRPEGKGSVNLVRVKELISRLKPEEVKIAQAYITAFDPRGENNKSSRIFKDLNKGNYSEAKLRAKHSSTNSNSFDALISILKDKIGYALALEVNTQRPGRFSDRWKVQLDVRNRLNTYDIVLGMGLHEEAYTILQKLVTACKTYELYFELITVLLKKMEFLKIRIPGKDIFSSKELMQINSDIEECLQCINAVINANYWYYVHLSYGEMEGKTPEILDKYRKGMNVLSNLHLETGSATVAYYMYYLKTVYYYEIEDFQSAEDAAKDWIRLVKTHKAIKDKNRESTTFLFLANVLIGQRKFSEALEALEIARSFIQPNRGNFQHVEDLAAYAHFYLGNYSEVEEKLEATINHPVYKAYLFKENRRRYLLASLLFIREDYKKCIKVLESLEELKDDRSGFLKGIKVLSVMAALFLDDETFLKSKLESLRKLMDELKKSDEYRERDLIIYDVLLALSKSGNNFKKVFNKYKQEIAMLEFSDRQYYWKIKSQELVIFHLWFNAKLEKKKYTVDVSQDLINFEKEQQRRTEKDSRQWADIPDSFSIQGYEKPSFM